MTIDELLNYLKEQLKGCTGYAFVDKAMADLKAKMLARKSFDVIKFKNWFHERNVVYKNSPLSFIAKCGYEDIDNGLFDKKVYKALNLEPMYIDMRKRGIKIEDNVFLIEITELYILNNGLMDVGSLKEWNIKAVDYVADSNDKTASNFISLFERTKTMRELKLPMQALKQEADKLLAEWVNNIKELEHDGNRAESETKENELPFDPKGKEVDDETIQAIRLYKSR